MRTRLARDALAMVSAAGLFCSTAHANLEVEVRNQLDLLRGIEPTGDPAKLSSINARMDQAWRFIEEHKPAAFPIVRTELQSSIEGSSADPFFCLDVGYLIAKDDSVHGIGLSLAALEHIDPTAKVMRANWQELFHFAMQLGRSGQETERYLAQMDRIYLSNTEGLEFFSAPHLVKFNAEDLVCMVYGVAGAAAAPHLCVAAAKSGPNQARLMHALTMVSTETDGPAVAAILASARSQAIAAAAITVLMETGGPTGRAAVVAYDASGADAETQAYVKKVSGAARAVDLAYFSRMLQAVYPAKKMSDGEVQKVLDTMEARNGADDSTPPICIFQCGIETKKLLAQLIRIRAASFRRENNHVFEDLRITNLLINALQFKQAGQKR